MPASPAGANIGLVFPIASFSEAQFERAVLPLGGQISRGIGVRSRGTQVSLIAFEHSEGRVTYSEATGILSFQSDRIDQCVDMADVVLPALLKDANIPEKDLVSAEFQAAYTARAPETALKSVSNTLAAPPTWINEVLGRPMITWGIRVVPNAAQGATDPLRSVTPWHELTVEPFADNPRNLFIRFLVRERTREALVAEINGLQLRLDKILSKVAI